MGNGETETGGLDRDMARRLHQALTASTDELFHVLQSPIMDVLRAALKNPCLNEPHLLALLQRHDLTDDLLHALGKSRIARESHAIRLMLAHYPGISASQLSEILPNLHLFELVTLCSLAGGTSDQKVAVERAVIQRLPTTPLGIKITLAHRATPAVVEYLLKEADPRLTVACLDNPRLKEGAVFQFLRSATANAETISMIARHPRWQNRPNLKQAILSNPRTPLIWFTHWLPALRVTEVRKLYESQRLSQLQRREVLAELERRQDGQR